MKLDGPLVSTDWLQSHLSEQKLRVYDTTIYLRPKLDGFGYQPESGLAEWQAEHIPGAGFLDVFGELSDRSSDIAFMMPPAALFAATMAAHGVADDSTVVLYNKGFPMWATRVWWMLRSVGFDEVAVLNGGYEKWKKEGRATDAQPPRHGPAVFTPRPRPQMWAAKDTMLKVVAGQGPVTINALAPAVYSGEKNQYGRAGHLPGTFNYYIANQQWLWVFLQNWLYIFKQPEGTGFLNHFWSLAVEEQFYLLWPFMMLALRKPKYMLAAILFILLAAICIRFYVWVYRIESLSYYSFYTFSRIDGICIGCAVALLQKIKPQFLRSYSTGIVLFFAAFNFGFYFVNSRYNFTFPYLAIVGYTTFAMLFGLLVYEGARGKTPWINVVFNNSILHFFGKISFGLYVWHWPIFVLLNPEITRWLQDEFGWQNNFTAPFICTALAIIISVLSFYFFEKKFLALKYRLASNKQKN